MARPTKDQKKETKPTSVRLTNDGTELWEKLAARLGLSKVGVLETAIRRVAKEEGVELSPLLESESVTQQKSSA